MTIIPSTVLALLLWKVSDTGGYPISYFSARYRLKEPQASFNNHNQDNSLMSSTWHWVVPEHINPLVVSYYIQSTLIIYIHLFERS